MGEQQHQSRKPDFTGAQEYASLQELPLRGDMLDYATELPEAPNPGQSTATERKAYKKQVQGLRDGYTEVYDDEREGLMVMTDLAHYLRNSAAMDNPHISHREKLEKVNDLTEYQFLITHHVIQKSDDRTYMDRFWQAIHLAGRKAHNPEGTAKLQTGVLSAVAAFKALEALGYKPQLPHPRQDAYDAIDIWADDTHAIQVKKYSGDVQVHRTDEISSPAIALENQATMVSTASSHPEMAKFKTKIERYNQREGTAVEGLFVQIPYGHVDKTTGEPSAELLRQLRTKLPGYHPGEQLAA